MTTTSSDRSEPTDTSSRPQSTTKVTPSAMMPMTLYWRSTCRMLPGLRMAGVTMAAPSKQHGQQDERRIAAQRAQNEVHPDCAQREM